MKYFVVLMSKIYSKNKYFLKRFRMFEMRNFQIYLGGSLIKIDISRVYQCFSSSSSLSPPHILMHRVFSQEYEVEKYPQNTQRICYA